MIYVSSVKGARAGKLQGTRPGPPMAAIAGNNRVEIVPANQTTYRDWDTNCEHGVDALTQRIPLKSVFALDYPAPEQTAVFQPKNYRTTRACFEGTRCFRAVRDDFATEYETSALFRGLEPHYERGNGTNGERFISINKGYFAAGLLQNITDRMAHFLEAEMGARGVHVSHTNSRGEWRLKGSLSAGRASALRRQQELQQGKFNGRHGHIDAARPTNWHYTCLLYVGDHGADRFAGGETLLIDEVEHGMSSRVRAGLLVEPRRGRLLAFSSGSENVHTALEATHGYRSLIQVWFGCSPYKRQEPSEADPRVEL